MPLTKDENMDKLPEFEGENMDTVLVNFRLSLCKDEKCYSTSKRQIVSMHSQKNVDGSLTTSYMNENLSY